MTILLKIILRRFFIVLLIAGIGVFFYFGYSYIFSRVITGEITGAKHLLESNAIITSPNVRAQSPQIFSFAIAIRDHKTGEIVTGSSEDRQWAAVKEGQCARAEFFPYPPWELSKAGTYFGARLLGLYDNCEIALKK